MASISGKNDGRLDLVLTRIVKLPRRLLWKAWTQPEHLKPWFTPAPWKTIDCEIDLRPGGIFRTTMLSPEGKEFPNIGCYLEIIEEERLVWTDALDPGFRPSSYPFFTAILTFEHHADGTKYMARALHKDDADRQKHADMGFEHGWGKALDQLVAMADRLVD
jgi:uncharacterized protein YndB with AHSA1/START domain